MSGQDHDDNPPEGYTKSTTRGPYTSHNGPFYHKVAADEFHHGVRVQQRHCNSRGITHGGMLMSFADGLLGTAVFRATKTVALTIRMNSDFLSSARPGEWLEGTARVTKATRSVAFCEAELFVGDRPVMKATGVFKLMARHKVPDGEPSVS
ncbi:MAG: PaaI family thioesterase [Parvibaculaceae bacterium]